MNNFFKKAFLAMRAESGSALVLIAVSFGVLVSAIALSTEVSNYAHSKSRFMQAVDEATLAAAASNADNPQGYATQYLRANLSLEPSYGQPGDADEGVLGADLTGGRMRVTNFTVTPNATRTEWTAVADATLETSLGSMFGVGNLSLHHTATVAWDRTSTSEIVGMIDVSGFACTRVTRTEQSANNIRIGFEEDRQCTKLDMMHEALRAITEIGVSYASIDGQVTQPVYKVGIVPFSFKVKLPNPTNLPAFLKNGEDRFPQFGGGDHYFQYTADAEGQSRQAPLPAVIPLSWVRNEADKQALLTQIDGLFTSDNREFFRPFVVRPTLGTFVSALMLDPDYNYLYGGEVPVPFHTPRNDKIVIMLTDAGHLGCCFTNVEGDWTKNFLYSYTEDQKGLRRADDMTTICTEMRAQGIEVYTILFDVTALDSAGGNEILDGFRACATDSAHYFEVPFGDTETLRNAYSVVGRAIMKLKLVK